MPLDSNTLHEVLASAREKLLACRTADGHWVGYLSSSALSTATAACALELYRRAAPGEHHDLANLVRNALGWIATTQNDDGGWGDTLDSPSNISTTVLCWAAINMATDIPDSVRVADARAEKWLRRTAGGLTPAHLTEAIESVYGKDRTFAVPILTMCAIAGRFGKGREAWCHIKALPFELAACPHQLFRWLRLSVVSYALPALIAIGQARHHHRPTRNPLTRMLRNAAKGVTLRVLQRIQPDPGGFLEAAPLTSFVLMSLVSIGQADHIVARRAASFLVSTVRDDGSWPIDTNLALWATTLSINALAAGGELTAGYSEDDRSRMKSWLLRQQYRTEHPYTHAAPGGWAWTHLAGGVPDADDTAGAILALRNLWDAEDSSKHPPEDILQSAARGIDWLIDLQNRDGGIPTFCRGWGRLPFDQSSPDLTAHALRAYAAWQEHLSPSLRKRVTRSTRAAVRFLLASQQADGSYMPLWFGNQSAPKQQNPVYGTSRVLHLGRMPTLDKTLLAPWTHSRDRAIRWLLDGQQANGGWGGAESTPASIEETALAVEALAYVAETDRNDDTGVTADELSLGIQRGASWLIEQTHDGTDFKSKPIGLYFAKLWYSEKLYPLMFSIAAWERTRHLLRNGTSHHHG